MPDRTADGHPARNEVRIPSWSRAAAAGGTTDEERGMLIRQAVGDRPNLRQRSTSIRPVRGPVLPIHSAGYYRLKLAGRAASVMVGATGIEPVTPTMST